MPIHGYPGGVITANPVAPTSTVATGVWTTEQQLQAVSQGNWPRPGPPQPISRSLRFNSADSAYLSRTFGTPTNANVWTFSCWIKRSALGAYGTIIGRVGSIYPVYQFITANTFGVYDSGSATTTAVFRDPSAWYHLVIQRTNSTTVNVYFNNVNQLTTTGQTNAFNLSGQTYSIGKSNSGEYFDGYMTEINFIDGQALTPSSFGQTNASTGVWEPIPYTGTYGTNGFYVNFSDNSGTTSTTLGKDSSGNGNNWTPNNFSVTAGAGNDSMVDSPTSYGTDTGVGGEVRGNYVTWNALDRNSSGTLANGNLDWTSGTTAHYGVRGTMSPPSGKWYFEVTAAAATSGTIAYGIGMANAANPLNVGAQSNTGAYLLYGVGTSLELEAAGVQGSTITGASIAANDVIQVAYDVDGSKMWVGKNNTWYNSSGGTTGNPSAGTNPSFSSLLANLFPFVEVYNNTVYANFGQRAFAYTAPSGFKALCTQNLPTPTIGATSTTQANDYFNVVLWTGNSSTQTVTGVGFQPDLVWAKKRSGAERHVWFDAVRGAGYQLSSDLTAAETYLSNTLTSFTSDGFSNGNNGYTNESPFTYVAWNWKANGAGSSNTAGTITSTVSANTTSGFSIVSFTSTGSQGTVGHGLGIAPSMIIMKQRSGTGAWSVYHVSIGNTKRLVLNATDAEATDSIWGNTTPTSTVFTQNVSASTPTVIAYCFAAVAGYSAFGSYTGNGSADGPFVYLGFRPEFVMIKNITTAGTSWEMFDNARETSNLMDLELLANSSNAEGTYTYGDFVSNGFKLRSTNNGVNQSTATLIYMAFAESPFKYSLAR